MRLKLFKSNSRTWVWLCTCAPAFVSSWILNSCQTHVKLKKLVWLCTCVSFLLYSVEAWIRVKLKSNSKQLRSMLLESNSKTWVWLCTCAPAFFLVLAEYWILGKLKSKSKNLVWLCTYVLCFFFWRLNFSQNQVKLKKCVWCYSGQTQRHVFDFVHTLLHWFLIENWILVKLKSNSKNWVWVCTCVLFFLCSWRLSFSQTQVKLKIFVISLKSNL